MNANSSDRAIRWQQEVEHSDIAMNKPLPWGSVDHAVTFRRTFPAHVRAFSAMETDLDLSMITASTSRDLNTFRSIGAKTWDASCMRLLEYRCVLDKALIMVRDIVLIDDGREDQLLIVHAVASYLKAICRHCAQGCEERESPGF